MATQHKIAKNSLLFSKIVLIFLVSFAGVLLLGSLYYQQNLLLNSQKSYSYKEISDKYQATNSAQIVSTSGKIVSKPSPKPNPIPQHSGKIVRVPILTYHYIGNNPNPADKARDNLEVAPDKFDEEMGYLSKQGYSAISFDTFYASLKGTASLPSKPIILTFDDGYIDFYLNAYPILRKYGLHAVSFISTGLINQGYYMSWAQIKEIDSSGLVSFQAHSVSHPNLVSLSDKDLQYQITESKKVLEGQLGKTVNTFAYPYGISDARVWQYVKNAGFIGAVGTWYGNQESEGVIYDMPRIKVGGGTTIESFASKL